MLRGFKDFIMRGNVIDLAVAVVIGTAFLQLVNAVVSGLITPLVGAVAGGTDLSQESWTVNGVRFGWGFVVDAAINFLVVAAVVYFLVILPMRTILERRRTGDEAEEPDEIQLLTEIRDALRQRA